MGFPATLRGISGFRDEEMDRETDRGRTSSEQPNIRLQPHYHGYNPPLTTSHERVTAEQTARIKLIEAAEP